MSKDKVKKAKVERTPEEKAAKKQKSANAKRQKIADFAILKNFIDQFGDDQQKVLARKYLAGKMMRVKTMTPLQLLNSIFADSPIASEDRIFSSHKFGRSEMRTNIIRALKNAAPEERLWVKFDSKSGSYEVVGRGANPPADWVGFIPADVIANE